MQALVSADELANDVGGAERLLEQHQVCVASTCIYDYRCLYINVMYRSYGQRLKLGRVSFTHWRHRVSSS